MKTPWWQAEKKGCHKDLFSLTHWIETDLNQESTYARWLSVMMNRWYKGLSPGQAKFTPSLFPDGNNMVINAIANIAETLTSRICANRPRPRFMTAGGDWDMRTKARRFDKYVEGIFQIERVYRETARAFKDAAWTGTGWIKVFPDKRDGRVKIRVERVFPNEMLVDEQASISSPPRTLYQRKWVPAEIVNALFPRNKSAIKRARRETRSTTSETITSADLIEVIEAWHLPSGKKSKDGRHVICIDGATLYDAEWEEEYFPFACMRWTEMPIGYKGWGLVEQLEPLHDEMNKIARRIQATHNLMANAWVVMEQGSVDPSQLTNQPGIIVEHQPGTQPPRVYTPPSMNSEVYAYQDRLFKLQHELSGVSQLSATSQKPAGIEAGIALRTLQDIETQRFGMLVRGWEDLHLDVARLIIATSRKWLSVDSEDPATDYEVRYLGRRYYESIKWSEVNMEEDSYVLQLWPTNLLPSTPAGKLATVQELMSAGLIEPSDAKALIEAPDLERHQALDTAQLDLYDFMVNKMLDKGEYAPPQPYIDLQLGIRRVGYHVMLAELEQAPADRLQLLRDWIAAASQMLIEAQEAQQPEMQEMPPGGEMPPEGGAAPIA